MDDLVGDVQVEILVAERAKPRHVGLERKRARADVAKQDRRKEGERLAAAELDGVDKSRFDDPPRHLCAPARSTTPEYPGGDTPDEMFVARFRQGAENRVEFVQRRPGEAVRDAARACNRTVAVH